MCVGVCHLPSSVRRPSASAAALPKIGKFRLTGLVAATQWPEKLVFRAVCKALPRLFNDFLDDSMTSSCSSVLALSATAAAALAVTHAADEQ